MVCIRTLMLALCALLLVGVRVFAFEQ